MYSPFEGDGVVEGEGVTESFMMNKPKKGGGDLNQDELALPTRGSRTRVPRLGLLRLRPDPVHGFPSREPLVDRIVFDPPQRCTPSIIRRQRGGVLSSPHDESSGGIGGFPGVETKSFSAT